MADLFESPFSSGMKRAGSSPPSPVFDLPPILFIAIASDSCASALIDPKLMAPVANRTMMSFSVSTFSSSMGSTSLNFNKPLIDALRLFSSLVCLENCQ